MVTVKLVVKARVRSLTIMALKSVFSRLKPLVWNEHVLNVTVGMLIIPESSDNKKLWCNCQLNPAILSEEIISFTRDAPSSYIITLFLPDPALSVSLVLFLSIFFFQRVQGRVGWALRTDCRGVRIPAGLSILFFCLRLQHQSQAVRHVRWPWLHTPIFPPFLRAPGIFQHLPFLRSGNGTRGLVATNNALQLGARRVWRYPDGTTSSKFSLFLPFVLPVGSAGMGFVTFRGFRPLF